MVRFLFLLFLAFTLSSGNNNLYAQDDEIISLKLITGDTILKEEGSPKYQIQIQSSKPVSADVNLLITFNSITAQSNDVSYTQVVKLDAGTSNSAPIDINAVDDAVYEDIETFYLPSYVSATATGGFSSSLILIVTDCGVKLIFSEAGVLVILLS